MFFVRVKITFIPQHLYSLKLVLVCGTACHLSHYIAVTHLFQAATENVAVLIYISH